MKSKITLLALCVLHFSIAAFAGDGAYWQPIHRDLVQSAGKRAVVPDQYKTYVLNSASFHEALFSLEEGYDHGILTDLPMPDGQFRTFRVWASGMMEPALAAKYPMIRTFTAEAVDNHSITAKIDFSPAGFHAMIFDGAATYYINPYSDAEDGNYICYYKKDCPHLSAMHCATGDAATQILDEEPAPQQKTNGTQRRNYRLALACTYEYSVAVGGATPTKASVLAQMVLIMNRVNGVYEREFSCHMTLVANTDTLIYLTAADPYTNNNGSTMLGENISNLNTRIGNANFDIGHVFSTGGGGVAYLGVLCNTGLKGGGVTGLTSPFGDPFAIDYVAHEMGHQFGSDHTFNSNLGACAGNGATALAFEPGSGATIMAYAGICGTDDLQSNSDAYFHAASLRAIVNHITGSGNTCPTITASTNVPNTYPDFTQAYSIPLWAPFELTAPAVTDATQDTLTYCWEEWDLGGFGQQWNTTNTAMPYFRSFTPTTSPTRVFPIMNNILAGNYFYKGERLPQAARTLKFILTTRDIYQGWGSFNASYDTDTVTLNAVATGDTFRVTSQATPIVINNGSTQTVTWNVAGTTAAPVNAATVNIYLSVDSGRTFPYLLASAVPNTGSASVVIPGIPSSTTKARIKVRPSNNVFFQVNRSNFTIISVPLAVDLMAFRATASGCDVQLSWTAGTNNEFRHFELQKSTDGSIFSSIAALPAAQDKDYHFTDRQTGDGNIFYRLKMLDLDDKATYSTTINVHMSCSGMQNVIVFPNPAHDQLNIRSNIHISSVTLIAANGQVALQQSGYKMGNILDISQLSSGLYLVIIEDIKGNRSTLKVVKE